jgi:hypothetical protein
MPQRSRASRSNNRSNDQSMMSHWGETAKDNPVKTAAAAAGAVAAGVFLWSKRNEISDQISRLSDQVTDWADEMRSGGSRELAMTEGPNESSAIESSRSTGTRSRSTRSTGKSSRSTSGQSRTSGANMNAGRSTTQPTAH